MGEELVKTKETTDIAPVVARIRELMERRGISAYKLGKLTGIDYMNLRKLLDGVATDAFYSTLVRIAQALEVDICEIVGGER